MPITWFGTCPLIVSSCWWCSCWALFGLLVPAAMRRRREAMRLRRELDRVRSRRERHGEPSDAAGSHGAHVSPLWQGRLARGRCVMGGRMASTDN